MNEPTAAADRLGRRRFLSITGGLVAAASVGLAAPGAASAAPGGHPTAPVAGRPVQARPDRVATYQIEGSDASVALPAGPAAAVLLHVARRFHYEIGTLRAGDVTGYATGPSAGDPFEAVYRAGTALAIRPSMYPAGATGGLFPHEVAIVRDVLAECEGVVRWGGDHPKTPKEGHFQLDVPPRDPALERVARKLGGQGAGAPADPFTPDRRRAAERLAERQVAGR
ncbi:hypothetical protein [Saccharothrix australiensis]|uniref:Uncharacterized protein n=1 Tax=Saccharothrix australiensis TaxID=2072 RepID=A0A495VVD6_9PSEU|nr:hypothetical protein [Saccharothrix australiensis]RKT52850.1 hypothetical protein C8E97_1389 [Saccharothrix australiensis]